MDAMVSRVRYPPCITAGELKSSRVRKLSSASRSFTPNAFSMAKVKSTKSSESAPRSSIRRDCGVMPDSWSARLSAISARTLVKTSSGMGISRSIGVAAGARLGAAHVDPYGHERARVAGRRRGILVRKAHRHKRDDMPGRGDAEEVADRVRRDQSSGHPPRPKHAGSSTQ